MFTGTYDHNIDEKYRITFPVRFREQVGEAGDHGVPRRQRGGAESLDDAARVFHGVAIACGRRPRRT